MLRNYLKIAFRTLRQNRGYALINLFGLTVGLACCLLLVLFVQDELSYDRFHANANHTYRIVRQNQDVDASVTTEAPLAATLAATYPEVTHATHLFRYWFTPLVSRGDEGFYEEDFFFTDAHFFDVFSFDFVAGDPATALDAPDAIVLTESAARKYFWDEDPIGKTVQVNVAHEFTVTGVLEDPPHNSHFSFDVLASSSSLPAVMGRADVLESWSLGAFPTYVVLEENADPAAFEAKLGGFAQQQFGADTATRYFMQPLTDIHLYSHYRGEIEANSDVRYVYVMAFLAFAILLLACINYTNLATARFTRRTKEVGIRKVVGARRRQLVAQFLGESLLLTLVSVLAAVVLLELLLPAFNTLVGRQLAFDAAGWGLPALVIGVALATGLLAGSYPAFYLSSFRPEAVLRTRVGSRRSAALRRALVVVQFATAIVLLAGTAVLFQQTEYLRSTNLGFAQDQVLVLPLRDEQVTQRPEALKQAFRALPEVRHVAASTALPGQPMPATTLRPEGALRDEPFRLFVEWIDDAYLSTLDVPLVAGRNISAALPTDAREAVLLNESAVADLGWAGPDEALGKTVNIWGEARTVVGVVEDFHFESLHEPIKALLFFPQFDHTGGLILRLRSDDLPATLARLEATWAELSPGQPFTYSFLDQDLARLYESEQRWSRVMTGAAFFALLIACLGLFGLAAFTAEQRTKEIGVRKVMGASAGQIVGLLSKDFAVLVLVAFVVAAPLAYLGASRYLDAFAYRIDLGVGTFLLAGALALSIALLTVSFQAVRAALADPVDALRYE